MEYEYTGKDKPFYDGWERACGMIRRHGWDKARDILNDEYPHNWRPTSAESWQHAKGCFACLQEMQ